MGVADDTLVIATSDNGASQEGNETGVLDEFRYFNGREEDMTSVAERLNDIGTRRSFSNYPWGWAQVGNTPGKRYKQNTHGGGVRDPLIISWPAGFSPEVRGTIRQQFHHITDITPTLLELFGYELPASVKGVEQQPIEGTSMAYTFTPEAADLSSVPTRKARQYFEMFGHRGMWADGWKAVTYHAAGTTLDDDVWELYHLDEDFSECHDLAEAHPEKLEVLVAAFWEDAKQYGVLPIDTSHLHALFAGHPVPGTPRARDHYTYFPPLVRVPVDSAPPFGARSWNLSAELDLGPNGSDGVILAIGTVNNGLSIFIKDGHLVYDHNAFTNHSVITSTKPLPAGDCTIGIDHLRIKAGPARVKLSVNGEPIGEGVVPDVPVMISSVGMDIGSNPSGVSDAYVAPFEFTGQIRKIEISTERALRPDDEAAAEFRTAMGTQ